MVTRECPTIQSKRILEYDGHIIRIKGFAKDGAEGYIEVNATREKLSINHISNAQEVIIVIGENLSSDKIKNYFPTADFENLLK